MWYICQWGYDYFWGEMQVMAVLGTCFGPGALWLQRGIGRES